MKSLDLLTFLASTGVALYSYFQFKTPFQWVGVGVFGGYALFIGFSVLNSLSPQKKVMVKLAGVTWTPEDFCRGWLITGRTGCGKTQSGINNITYQCFLNCPNWGGICLDQKGLYWEILVQMAKHFRRDQDLVLLQTRPIDSPEDWTPKHTINITGNNAVPASTYAKTIVDTSSSLTGGKGETPFFKLKSQIAIQIGFDILRYLEAYVTIPNVHHLLLTSEGQNEAIKLLTTIGDQKSLSLLETFRDQYLNQPPEQLGGVQATIDNYLRFFLNPEISDVFCANEPTFNINQIDQGKIVCIAMPQKYQAERLYVNTILKLAYYFHALNRFDKKKEERDKDNILILFADEGQEIITAAESVFADHRSAGVIREAKATIVLATQAYSSLMSVLDKKHAEVLMLNLSNELIFQAANDESAKIASKNIGEREIVEKSWGYTAGKQSKNYQKKIKPFFEAYQLRKFKKFQCVVRHCEKKWKKKFLCPINPNGTYPKWLYSIRPELALLHYFKKNKPFVPQSKLEGAL